LPVLVIDSAKSEPNINPIPNDAIVRISRVRIKSKVSLKLFEVSNVIPNIRAKVIKIIEDAIPQYIGSL